MLPKPTLSICCITFNHAKYIKECIEGFLSQKTDFVVEILIFDDASTDGTQEIIQEYAKNNSNIITFLQKENQWIKKKYGLVDWLFPVAKGKYIALCEGDDYWTDPLKLQKQVDFLESNLGYVICFHKVNILSKGTIIKDLVSEGVPETTTIIDLAKKNYMHTCSVVFRNNLFPISPEYFREVPVGDYFLHLLNARYGDIKYFDEVMGVYRVHNSSTWSSKTQEEQILLWVPFLQKIKPNFDKHVQNVIDQQIASCAKIVKNENLGIDVIEIGSKIIQKTKNLIKKIIRKIVCVFF